MKHKASIFFALFCTVKSYAGTELPPQTIKVIANGWTGTGLYIWTNEELKAEGCSSGVIFMKPEHPWKSEVISMTLSAFHARSKVSFYVEGCSGANLNLKAVKLSH